MLNGVVNPVMQLYKAKYTSDLVDENMLSEALMTAPHQISTAVTYLLGQHARPNLDFLTGGLGNKVIVTNRQFEWAVAVDNQRAVTINKAVWNGQVIDTTNFDAATMTPGLGNTTITLWLADKWFGPGAILVFDDRDFMVRVEGAPYQDGNDWVYTVRIANSQTASYVPGNLLLPGAQVSRNGSAYEEYSEEADIVNYSTPFKLRNHLTTIRLSYDCTGDAYSSVMVMSLKDPNSNRTTNLWTTLQEWTAIQQFQEMIDKTLVYSQYNANPDGTTDLKGTNGRPVWNDTHLIIVI